MSKNPGNFFKPRKKERHGVYISNQTVLDKDCSATTKVYSKGNGMTGLVRGVHVTRVNQKSDVWRVTGHKGLKDVLPSSKLHRRVI